MVLCIRAGEDEQSPRKVKLSNVAHHPAGVFLDKARPSPVGRTRQPTRRLRPLINSGGRKRDEMAFQFNAVESAVARAKLSIWSLFQFFCTIRMITRRRCVVLCDFISQGSYLKNIRSEYESINPKAASQRSDLCASKAQKIFCSPPYVVALVEINPS